MARIMGFDWEDYPAPDVPARSADHNGVTDACVPVAGVPLCGARPATYSDANVTTAVNPFSSASKYGDPPHRAELAADESGDLGGASAPQRKGFGPFFLAIN